MVIVEIIPEVCVLSVTISYVNGVSYGSSTTLTYHVQGWLHVEDPIDKGRGLARRRKINITRA